MTARPRGLGPALEAFLAGVLCRSAHAGGQSVAGYSACVIAAWPADDHEGLMSFIALSALAEEVVGR